MICRVRIGQLGALAFVLLLGFSASAINIKNVSNEDLSRLQQRFRLFQSPSSPLARQQVLNKPWTCDFYGIRSRMQVEKDLLLYSFNESDSKVVNRGAQPIKNYRWTEAGLKGSNDRFLDVVRVSHDRSQLVAELSIKAPTTSKTKVQETQSLVSPHRRVVAYAHCR